MDNAKVAAILTEIAEYLEMQGIHFKPRAYERAAQSVSSLPDDIGTRYAQGGKKALDDIPGVGASIAKKIAELLDTGHMKYYERLKAKIPVRLAELESIEGLGPRHIRTLFEKLHITTLKSLERAARAGKIADLPGFGKKAEENILKGIAFVHAFQGRFPLGAVLPEIRRLAEHLRALPGVERLEIAGSIRRWKETVGDADLVVVSSHPKPIMAHFVTMPEVGHVYAHGETKSAIKLKNGLDVDLRIVSPRSFGAALNYFTGSKEHNITLREIALKKGYKLNEYGLFEGKRYIAGASEGELYRALGMSYVEPEMRENTGEIECAKRHTLPHLIGYADLQGDLQVQTDWTDGAHSLEEMAQAAITRGLSYIAITDHTKSLAMTGGADEKKLLRQMDAIDALNKKFKGKITLLKGAEVNILKDGSLDIADEVLAKLDVVGVAVHSHFNLSRKDQTQRIIRAMENRHVDIVFHLTGRIIHKRPPISLDIDAVLRAAKRTHTVLEINAFPERLDIRDEVVRAALQHGIVFSVDSDAHAIDHFQYLEYGIATARRGWAEKKDVVNAWPLPVMKKKLK
ncbi:MAG: DNA polymerase/3'-5' exonuclease PolX [Patescibacteria group bacterium]|nr:DNA polymerase/3'-5' exonuclease PolX [Patescibacteria group bacterium]MDE2438240.1 DNA polymerase/3'-5' exonuclease PolX [Patescibacteria group bacterium]